jgi:hypothetical protein
MEYLGNMPNIALPFVGLAMDHDVEPGSAELL